MNDTLGNRVLSQLDDVNADAGRILHNQLHSKCNKLVTKNSF